MQKTQYLGILGFLVMAGAISYAFIIGDFFAEANVMLPLPWFHLSMIDLYAGFLLFSGWIYYRERSILIAVMWILLVLTLGNLTSFLYLTFAAFSARGDWRSFWMGSKAHVTSSTRS